MPVLERNFRSIWLTAQAERPDILEVTWRLVRGLLLEGELPPNVKQMIIVRVSTTNHQRLSLLQSDSHPRLASFCRETRKVLRCVALSRPL